MNSITLAKVKKMPGKHTAPTSLKSITTALDHEFDVLSCREDLVKWAVTEENCQWINPTFLKQKTGLMVVGLGKVHAVRTAVFVTDRIIQQLSKEPSSLLLTHHSFDYFEDERGLQPIRQDQIQKLAEQGHSIYVAHAPLDTHPVYGTAVALAAEVGIKPLEHFYDYFGRPTAVVGEVGGGEFQEFAEHVRKCLLRPKISVAQHMPRVRKIAIVAGGGDLPDVLQEAYDLGADTLLLGTLENRWAVPGVQEAHEQFLRLNEKLRLNLIGGSHFGTERPAMIRVARLFERLGVSCEYCEDEELLAAL